MTIRKPRRYGAVIKNAEGLQVILDATLSDSRGLSAEVSSDPIEDGSSIAHNIIIQPETFSLTGEITRTPLYEAGSDTRLEDGIEDLFLMLRSRSPVSITNGLHVLKNYAITNLSVDRSEGQGQSASISMSFQQLIITEPETARLPPPKVEAEQRDAATPTGDAGSQSPEESSGNEIKDEVSSSIAAQGFDFLTGGA